MGVAGCSLSGCERRAWHAALSALSPERWGAVSSAGQNERITNVHTVGSKGQEADCLFLSRYIRYWIKPSGKQQNKAPLAFIFLYILMSPNPNISHWEGTCMQTSSFSFINDDLQIKPFGARSWHFPKQTMKSTDQSLSCSKQEGTCCSKEWSWRRIPVTNWQLPNGRLQCDSLTAAWFWVGSHVLMHVSWPLGTDLEKQSRCWQWLAAGTAGL